MFVLREREILISFNFSGFIFYLRNYTQNFIILSIHVDVGKITHLDLGLKIQKIKSLNLESFVFFFKKKL